MDADTMSAPPDLDPTEFPYEGPPPIDVCIKRLEATRGLSQFGLQWVNDFNQVLQFARDNVGGVKRIDSPPGRPDLHQWTGHEWVPIGYSIEKATRPFPTPPS